MGEQARRWAWHGIGREIARGRAAEHAIVCPNRWKVRKFARVAFGHRCKAAREDARSARTWKRSGSYASDDATVIFGTAYDESPF